MTDFLQEWPNLLVRWVHVIAAIMWIGDSFLFMWLDSHLSAPSKPRDGDVAGELWMTHSGGFYEVVKRRSLKSGEMPPALYWFKWESYTTWLSGILLLVIVYYLSAEAYLIDKTVADLSPAVAIAISIGALPVVFVFYDLLWRTPLARSQQAFAVVGLGIIVGLAYLYTHLFSGRAAFLQLGATLGTLMSANVFFRIIPAQKHMLAATKAGTKVDTSYGLRAKGRSIHNHYLTLPVLFTMLSNHFPSTYGNSLNWVVLTLLFVFGISLKYVMNFRGRSPWLVWVSLVGSLAGAVFLTRPVHAAPKVSDALANHPEVSFAQVNAIVQARCVTCHQPKTTHPMFPAPPNGVLLDTPEAISKHAARIFFRTVETKTMPLANLTDMTEEERRVIGTWFAQGANVSAVGGKSTVAMAAVEAGVAASPATDAGATPSDAGARAATPAELAQQRFASICATCHGAAGNGQGPAAAGLTTKPRDYSDAQWQKSVTDEELKKIILEGGPAVGKSPLMPPNPDLRDKPEVVAELVKIVRGFGPK